MLSVDHLAHHAPSAVGSTNEYLRLIQAEVVKGIARIVDFRRRDFLETTKERVAPGIGAGQKNTQQPRMAAKKG